MSSVGAISVEIEMKIHTRLSTWFVVVSVLMTTFTAFPSWPSAVVHVINIAVLGLALWLARNEGKGEK